MKSTLSAFLAGTLFGLGLIVSEMVNPRRVQGFLDLFGHWDPTLVFVMVGAFVVTATGYKLVLSRPAPTFAPSFSVPTNRTIDTRLILGAILFGIGWGLSGLCPGPAIVSVATFSPSILIFIVAMVAGMKLFDVFNKKT